MQRGPAWLPALTIVLACGPPLRAELRGLVCGISTFRNQQSFPDLPGAANDASLIGDLLLLAGAAPANVKVLRDSDATRARLVSELEALMRRTGEGDTAVVAAATHGTLVIDNLAGDHRQPRDEQDSKNDAAIVPYDAEKGRPESLLIDDQLAWYLAQAKGEVVFIADTCDSVGMERGGLEFNDVAGLLPTDGTPLRGAIPKNPRVIALALKSAQRGAVQELRQIPAVKPIAAPAGALTYALYGAVLDSTWPSYSDLATRVDDLMRGWDRPYRLHVEGDQQKRGRPLFGQRPGVPDLERTVRLVNPRQRDVRRADLRPGRRHAPAGRRRDLDAAEGAHARLAILIGLNRNRDPRLTPLSGAEMDVRLLDDLLRTRGWETILLSREVGSAALEPTKANILRTLAGVAGVRGDEYDTIFVVFCGHGRLARAADGAEEAYLLNYDADLDPGKLASTAISLRDFAASLAHTKARTRIAMLDMCHPQDRSAMDLAARELDTEWIVITSAAASETAQELPVQPSDALLELAPLAARPGGLFSRMLLEALGRRTTDSNNDGDIDLWEAYLAAEKLCTAAVPRGPLALQSPSFRGSSAAAHAVRIGPTPCPPAADGLLTGFEAVQPPLIAFGSWYGGEAAGHESLVALAGGGTALQFDYDIPAGSRQGAGVWLRAAIEPPPAGFRAVVFDLLADEARPCPGELVIELKRPGVHLGKVRVTQRFQPAPGRWTTIQVPLVGAPPVGTHLSTDTELVLTVDTDLPASQRQGRFTIDNVYLIAASEGD